MLLRVVAPPCQVVIRPQGVDGFTELVDCEPDELRKLFKVGWWVGGGGADTDTVSRAGYL
jgi:hypothetical protein